MRLELPFPEAIALVTAASPLPPMVTFLSCTGDTVLADVDLRALHPDSLALRLAFAAAGTVSVSARFAGFATGVATFAVKVHARGLPAHKLVPYLLSTVNSAIQRSGVPAGVVQVADGEHEPHLRIDVQRAVETAVRGIRVSSFDLRDATILLEAEIGQIERVDPPSAESAPPAS